MNQKHSFTDFSKPVIAPQFEGVLLVSSVITHIKCLQSTKWQFTQTGGWTPSQLGLLGFIMSMPQKTSVTRSLRFVSSAAAGPASSRCNGIP